LGNLHFDIVSDLELRNSDFASLGISTLVERALQIHPFFAKQTQFQKKSNGRNRFVNKGIRTNGHLVRREKQSQNEPNQSQFKPNFSSFGPDRPPFGCNITIGDFLD
jgi:hypothetical protein